MTIALATRAGLGTDSLRHFKEEVKEMVAGQECGISTNGFNAFQEDDKLRCFTMKRLKRTLDD